MGGDRSHFLARLVARETRGVLITGLQAQGTLGRRLVDGAKWVRILGADISGCAAIHIVVGLSAHADQPALLGWSANFRKPPARTFVVHGEASTTLAFAERLRAERGWDGAVPEPGASWPMRTITKRRGALHTW